MEIRIISSLEKVLPRPELEAAPLTALSAAAGERVACQVAIRSDANDRFRLVADSPLRDRISLREVQLVPCDYPAVRSDPFKISAEPGLYPAPLVPADDRPLRALWGAWMAVWVTVDLPADAAPGTFPITFRAIPDSPATLPWPARQFPEATATLTLEILPFALPPQTLHNINWFYVDCIAHHYRLAPWTEPLWNLLGRYFDDMAAHGNNVLYTPLWSVPLDTGVGHERPTAQLLDITERDGHYQFDFSNLDRWIALARQHGIELFEMSHIFTQWGARFTPKIIVNGTRRFGWDVAADSPEYQDFLGQLLPQLVQFLRSRNLSRKCYFHISDEPSLVHLDSYRKASDIVKALVDEEEFPIIDAMSDLDFFRTGLMRRPVPVTVTVDQFRDEPVAQRWVYYCGNVQDNLPNRQYGVPSIRTRIIGVLLYLYRMDGFLHWGYNFWFSQFSLDWDIDPWKDTTASRAHVGGGSFNVFPGPDGPIDTIAFESFTEGLQDLRALQLHERLLGRDATVALIHDGLDYTLDMRHYPHDPQWLLDLRERLNRAIAAANQRRS